MAKLAKRGQVWVVNLEPSFGREIHKKRPAVIISNNKVNQNTPHIVIVPSSSIVPSVLSDDLVFLGKVPGFTKESILVPLFIRSIDQARLVKKIGTLNKDKLLELENALKLVLGMNKTA